MISKAVPELHLPADSAGMPVVADEVGELERLLEFLEEDFDGRAASQISFRLPERAIWP